MKFFPPDSSVARDPAGACAGEGERLLTRLAAGLNDALDALAGSLEPDVSVYWQRQPLEGFESRPLRALADEEGE